MTAGENAQIVQRAYEAINWPTWTRSLRSSTRACCGTRQGAAPSLATTKGARRRSIGRYGGEAGRTFKAALQRVFESDDGCVVGVHHNSAERNGEHLDTGCCIVFEIKDERITDGREHFFDLYNWDGFWS